MTYLVMKFLVLCTTLNKIESLFNLLINLFFKESCIGKKLKLTINNIKIKTPLTIPKTPPKILSIFCSILTLSRL